MNSQPKLVGVPTTQDDLDRVVDTHIASVPQALAALGRMEAQFASARTYEELQIIQAAAEVFARPYRRVEQVKHKAEDVVLLASEQIGRAILDVQKAAALADRRARGRRLQIPRREKHPHPR